MRAPSTRRAFRCLGRKYRGKWISEADVMSRAGVSVLPNVGVLPLAGPRMPAGPGNEMHVETKPISS